MVDWFDFKYNGIKTKRTIAVAKIIERPRLLLRMLYKKVIKLASGNTNNLSQSPVAVAAVIGSVEILHPDNNPMVKTKNNNKYFQNFIIK